MSIATIENPTADLRSLKRHSMVGLLGIVGLFGGLIIWAANTDIAGAVTAAPA